MAKPRTPGQLLSLAMFRADPLSTVIGRRFTAKPEAPPPLGPPPLRVARVIMDGDDVGTDVPMLYDDAFFLFQKDVLMRLGLQKYHGATFPMMTFMVLRTATEQDFYDIDRFVLKAKQAGARL